MKMLGESRNQCQGCKQYFNSIKTFERHRTGKYGVDRRCRTTEEMLEMGWLLNADGFWISSKRTKFPDKEMNHEDD